jgi:hypothetical protein
MSRLSLRGEGGTWWSKMITGVPESAMGTSTSSCPDPTSAVITTGGASWRIEAPAAASRPRNPERWMARPSRRNARSKMAPAFKPSPSASTTTRAVPFVARSARTASSTRPARPGPTSSTSSFIEVAEAPAGADIAAHYSTISFALESE